MASQNCQQPDWHYMSTKQLNTSATRSETQYFAFSYLANTEKIWEVVHLSSGVITIRVNTEKFLVLADLKSRGKMINILQSFTFTTVTER
jgi:hypothetical protein